MLGDYSDQILPCGVNKQANMNGTKRREGFHSNSLASTSDCDGCADRLSDSFSSSSTGSNKRARVNDVSSRINAFAFERSSTSSVYNNAYASGVATTRSADGTPHEVAKLLATLELLPDSGLMKDPEHWFHRLCYLFANLLKDRPQGLEASRVERLKRHLHCRDNGELNANLVAASYLKIHPDIHEVQCPQSDTFPKYLPSPIRQRLFHGKFVPMRHIIYGEALTLGIACHMIDNRKLPSEPYPLNIKTDSPPQEFVMDIRRPDIIRGLTTHSIILSSRFPRLAARMHHLIRHMWILLYQEETDVQAAMDLYDAYFTEFERQLNLLTFMPMDSFPSQLIEQVLNKHNSDASDIN